MQNNFEILLERSISYIKTSIQLFKLNSLNKILNVFSALISKAVAVLFLIMFILIASLGVAILLGNALAEMWYGFAIVAAFYAVIAIAVGLFLNKWIKESVSNFILKQIINNESHEKP